MPKETSEITLDETKLFLFLGASDSGKSYAATSFGLASEKYGGTDPRPCYLMELDGRLAALKGRPVVFDSFNNIEGAIGVIKKLAELRKTCIQYGKAPFHTLIIDSFTSFNDFAIADSLEVTEQKRDSGESKGRVRGELTLMTIEDYGYEAEAVRKLLWENLTDLKRFCNVIVVAHEVEHYRPVKVKAGEPTRTELVGFKLLARDKIAAKIPTRFDEIYHFLPKDKIISQQHIRRQVVFQDEIARTSFPQLSKTTAEFDISGQEFYPFWLKLIQSPISNKEVKK